MMLRSGLASLLLATALAGCRDAPPPAQAPRSPWGPQGPAAAAAPVDFGEYVWVERTHSSARVNATCAQSIVYEMRTAGYRWGEVLVIEAHTDHWVAGQAKISLGSHPAASTFFSSERRPVSNSVDVGDDRRCRGGAPPTAGVPAPTGATTAPPVLLPGAPAATTPASGAPSPVITLDGRIGFDARPSSQIFRHDMDHYFGKGTLDVPPVGAGETLKVEFWGVSSIDWIGVTFEVRTYEVVPKNEASYRAFLEAKHHGFEHPPDQRAHYAECHDRIGAPECADIRLMQCQRDAATLARPECADVKHDLDESSRINANSTGTPPPPSLAEAPPPRPSENALWIPGHWVLVNGVWSFWSVGFWRVDESDRTQGKTASAPALPPPPRVEPETHQAPPAPGVVWTPGYWHWSSSWQWVGGAWRAPPTRTTTWRPAKWHADVRVHGTFRLDPGGWLTR